MWLLGFELRTFRRAVRCSYPLSHLTSPIQVIFILSSSLMTGVEDVIFDLSTSTTWLCSISPPCHGCWLSSGSITQSSLFLLLVSLNMVLYESSRQKPITVKHILIGFKVTFQRENSCHILKPNQEQEVC